MITSLVLAAAGDPVVDVWDQILSVPERRNVANIINNASVLYLSGLAAAIGFRMNLFNIGVDGQYRVAAFTAAVVAGEAWLPGYLNTVLAILCAMAVGAMWAGIAGVLRATRGVSEVISTIMLNAIATGLVAYLLRKASVRVEGSNAIGTKKIPESSQIPSISIGDGPGQEVYGFVFIAVLVGFLYWFVLNKTRFGFDLRATGRSTTAATASGIKSRRMVIFAMLISGAVAGLVGLPILFGDSLQLRLDVPVRAGLRRDRDRAARPQPPGRDRDRCAAVRLPRRAVQPAPDPGGGLARHRGHHPGRHRADRGHLLRGRAPLRRPARTAGRCPSCSSAEREEVPA